MIRVLLAVLIGGMAFVIAAIIRRRQPDAPTQGTHQLPTQIDRADFAQHTAPWIVVVFTSATCNTCADVLSKALVVKCSDVSVVHVEFPTDDAMHKRYKIDGVPALVVADQDGVVRAGFLGPVKAQDLWAAIAECRHPGTSPEPQLGKLSD